MLSTKILKLRLSRIAKGKEHLSTQDKLMLVSMESPDLSANFFLKLRNKKTQSAMRCMLI